MISSARILGVPVTDPVGRGIVTSRAARRHDHGCTGSSQRTRCLLAQAAGGTGDHHPAA